MSKTRQKYEFGRSSVTVELIDVEHSSAQVLVSSDDHELSMGGGVSMALLAAGGEAIRGDAAKHVPAKVGDVIVTSAGTLPARHIFHAITRLRHAPRSEDRDFNRGVIESATQKCLAKLRSMDLHSIAFPALGAGYAGFPVMDVAEMMAKVIVKALKSSPDPGLHVTVCIRPDDLAKDVDYREFFNRFDERTGLVAHVVRDHAVVMIHGIRTDAQWFQSLSELLQEQDHAIHPVEAGYGYLDLIRFLIPVERIRRASVERVRGKLDSTRENPRIRQVSVVAHSFGTYIVGEILKSDASLRLRRLLLCGSILPPTFDWRTHAKRVDALADPNMVTQRVVNDCGWRDIWPVFAESVTWGYGSAGRFGFKTPEVKDRYHPAGHSDFFEHDFVRDYWVPLLSGGLVVAGPNGQPPTAWWTQALLIAKVRWFILLAVAAIVAWAAWR